MQSVNNVVAPGTLYDPPPKVEMSDSDESDSDQWTLDDWEESVNSSDVMPLSSSSEEDDDDVFTDYPKITKYLVGS